MSDGTLVWVYADGVCDLFHPGHVNYLRRARSLGDRLVVGLASEATAAAYKPVPIMSMEERMVMVAACRYVDKLLPEAPPVCDTTFLDSIGAAFACHGDDITPAELERSYPGLMAAGRMRLLPYTKEVSSRQIIERIAKRLKDGSLRVRL